MFGRSALMAAIADLKDGMTRMPLNAEVAI
jgi:hypothetical protein